MTRFKKAAEGFWIFIAVICIYGAIGFFGGGILIALIKWCAHQWGAIF